MGSPGRVREQALQVLLPLPLLRWDQAGGPVSEHLGWGLSGAGGVLGGGAGRQGSRSIRAPTHCVALDLPLREGRPCFWVAQEGRGIQVLDFRELGHEGA